MHASPSLISPNVELRDSYCGFVREFIQRAEKLVPFVLALDHSDFDAFVARLANYSKGVGIPAGFVAHSTYWLVDAAQQIVGVSNIRHSLTAALRGEGGNIGYGIRPSARGRGLGTEILRLSLARARQLGLMEVLLTCGKANSRSIAVIRRNGGVLRSEKYLADRGDMVQRYVIQT